MSKADSLLRVARARVNKRALEKLKAEHAAFIRGLNPEDAAALDAHLQGPYHSMDYGYQGDRYGSEELKDRLEDLMRRAPRVPEDVTVWRGTTESKFLPRNRYPLTTTADKGSAQTYAEGWMEPRSQETDPALLSEILVPEGSPGLMFEERAFEDLTGSMMPFGDEAELVLPQGKIETIEELQDLVDRLGAPAKKEEYRIKQKLKEYIPPFRRGGVAHGYA